MRLTKRYPNGVVMTDQEVLEKLATYEDTGLSPEEFRGKTERVLELYGKLKPYADAEEQGRLVILPCKVGDTVWSRDVEPWTVVSVEWFSRRVTQLHCKSPVTGRGMTFSVGKRSLGKTVFLTREEAEAALKGGQDDGT